MKIDNELIIEAKEILGKRAADIIASGMSIAKWNQKELKGCCPFHSEKTPSFIWDHKHNCFKCFGCGKTLDIVEYYMDYKRMNFIEAIKELFKETNTKYDFEDLNVRNRKNKENKPYIYPEAVENNSVEEIKDYLALRCISKETLLKCGIKQNKGNIVFEYKNENGVLLLVKYRPARKVVKPDIKTWAQKGKDTAPVLFGMDKIDTTKPLLICEGEIDRLSCIEAGFNNTVSVPFGAGNYSWIEYNWEWLEQFNQIIVWSDNDEAGQKMKDEIIPRLGEYRCKIVKGKRNDINLQLYADGKESIMKSISNAKEVPIKDIVSMEDVGEFDINKVPKIRSGYTQLDKYISGFVIPSVNVITGVNSSGKSTLINQMCVCEPLEQGYKTFIISAELPSRQLKSWIEFPMAGPENIKEFDNGPNKPKGYYVDKKIKYEMSKWYKNKIFFYENKDDDYSKTAIFKKMEEMVRKYGIKNILIDNLMMIDLECNSYELNKHQKEFVLNLKRFTKRFNCVIHLIAHPRKLDAIRRLSKLDVCGSGDITNLADYVMAIHRVKDEEKEPTEVKGKTIPGCPFDCILDLFKNRPLGYQDKAIGLHFNYRSKRYYGDSDNEYKKYKWEDMRDKMEIRPEFIYKEQDVKCPWD